MPYATKTKKSPHDRLETYEKWSAGATLGILIGIIIEIVVLAYYEYHPGWKFWSSVAANVFIGAGLLIEFFCIRWTIIASREAEDENRAKLAAALDRAVAAEQELLEFRKTRRTALMPDSIGFTTELRKCSGHRTNAQPPHLSSPPQAPAAMLP